MALQIRYTGEFLGRTNTVWRTEIWQEAEVPFPAVGELEYPGEGALTLEWAHTDKEESLCGSVGTLHLVSPGDRTYEDLYIIKPGGIRLDVYRNGTLYWSGTLDPEFYQEPYAYGSQYEVELIFSDFGMLDRITYALSGIRTLRELVDDALAKTRIRYARLDQRYITTALGSGSAAMTLDDLSVHSENFYNEEGEANTLKEVLEGILQPLGLRMVQRSGTVYIYDLNGLYTLAPEQAIAWTDENQMMGTDKVANKAKVTFSPYANAEVMGDTLVYGGRYHNNANLEYDASGWETEYYSYFPDYSSVFDKENVSFSIFLSTKGSGLEQISPVARYFHIQPMLGGQESEGVAYSFCTGGHGDLRSGKPKRKLGNPETKDQTVLMRTHRIPVQALEKNDRNRYFRLSMELMLDMRYNPFTEPGKYNEEGNQKDLANYRFNFVQVPASVVLYSDNGTPLLHYENRNICDLTLIHGNLDRKTEGEWVAGAGGYDNCRLEWYSNEDRHFQSGVSGWKRNRHNIGLSVLNAYESFKQLPEGQYIPYPPQGGYLEVTVYTGIYIYEWSDKVSGQIKVAPPDWYSKIRWLLYKAPTIEVVNKNITHSQVESEDLEYVGVLNADAKEDLELNTICGTSEQIIPTARGVYLRSSDHYMVKALSRAGRTTQAEQLLIGTLYSQFAGRKTCLSGTAALLYDGLRSYTEQCQDEKKFILLSDVQNLQEDESELEIVELRPDEYQAEDE